MYYTATSEPAGGNHVVVATESQDLITWHGRTIVYRDHACGTGGGPTESPFVVACDGRYLLFIGPDWDTITRNFETTSRYSYDGYRTTRVFESDDPLHFEATSQVATVLAHAAEVITDEQGDTWVSHCGWGQGGVYLAPLTIT